MHEVILHFHDKKHAHKLLRNLHNGKGMVVRPEMVGAGWLSGITNGFKQIASNPEVQKIGKQIGQKALDKGIDMGKQYLEQKMSGSGLFGEIGNVVDELTGKGIGRGRGRPRKSHKMEHGDGIFGSIGNVIDAISGDGVKGKRTPKMSRSLKLYRGGSFSPL